MPETLWRSGNIFLRLACLGIVLFLLVTSFNVWEQLHFAKLKSERLTAAYEFVKKVANEACLTKLQFEGVAKLEGLESKILHSPYDNELFDEALPTALLVYVDPSGIPFDPEDYEIFQFGPTGCLVTK